MVKIFVGAPVRNRGWILQRHIDGLLRQGINFETCYILNDSSDNTEEILRNNNINFIKKNLGQEYGHLRGQYSYRNLAILRNFLLEEFLKSDCDYLFSIDTDIVISDGSLQCLIDNDKDIVSMLIQNHPTYRAHNFFIDGKHVEDVKEGLIPVDMTGAVYLISREVIESGVKYDYHIKGEDIAFCDLAIEKGFKIYCDTRLRPIHAFEFGMDLVASIEPNITKSSNIDKGLDISFKKDVNDKIVELANTSIELLDYLETTNKMTNLNNTLILLTDLFNAIYEIEKVTEKHVKDVEFGLKRKELHGVMNDIINSIESDNMKVEVDILISRLKFSFINWIKELKGVL